MRSAAPIALRVRLTNNDSRQASGPAVCDHEAGNGAAPLQECRLSPRVSSAPADVGDQNRIASYKSVTSRIPFVAPKPHGLLHVARSLAKT